MYYSIVVWNGFRKGRGNPLKPRVPQYLFCYEFARTIHPTSLTKVVAIDAILFETVFSAPSPVIGIVADSILDRLTGRGPIVKYGVTGVFPANHFIIINAVIVIIKGIGYSRQGC